MALHNAEAPLPSGAPAAAAPTTILDVLGRHARERGEARAFTFLARGEEPVATVSFSALDARARGVAADLVRRGLQGERVLLLCVPGMELVVSFFACLYAGAVPVPAAPPRPRRGWSRLLGIAADADPAAVLLDADVEAVWHQGAPERPPLARLPVVAIDSASFTRPDWKPPPVEDGGLAFLQYTSGSTSEPRGVMVSHRNLLHNQEMIRRAFDQSEDSVIVGWLPLHHDMGLIGNVIQPLYVGAHSVLMPPVSFLERPLRWLQAIDRYRATTSGGPNFGYELCLRKIPPEEREGLDLSSWSVAFNGAEPVRAETLDRFAEVFAEQGFRRQAFFPCYGLAEATLFVAGGEVGAEAPVREVAGLADGLAVPAAPGVTGGRRIVGCGHAWLGQQVRIVEPKSGRPMAPGRVGEIWVRGESVADGYWCRPQETAETFGACLAGGEGPFLRTGDLGFVADEELFVTGRRKDLVILRGRNHYPQDLEHTAQASHPDLSSNGGAAFSVDVEGEERLVIAHEARRRKGIDAEGVGRAVRRAISEEHEVQVHDLVLLAPGGLPRTTSGKIRRAACRQAYCEGLLDEIGRATTLAEPTEGPCRVAEAGGGRGGEAPEELVTAVLARRLGVAAEAIDLAQPVSAYGLDSLSAVAIQHDLETTIGIELPIGRLLAGASGADLVAEVRAAAPVKAQPIPAAPPASDGAFPLSRGQRTLWFLERLAEGVPVNTLYAAVRLPQPVDPGRLRVAIEHLVTLHPQLRATFGRAGEELRQRVTGRNGFDLRIDDLDSGRTDVVDRLLELAEAPLDLERGPLVRLHLLRDGDRDGQILLLVTHHLVSDLWSVSLLFEQLDEIGTALDAGDGPRSPPDGPDYREYVAWQEALLAGPRGRVLREYWRGQLLDAPEALLLPTDRPRPPIRSFRGGWASRRVSADLFAGVGALARRQGTTPYTVLLSAFVTLLHRYSGSGDVVVGTPAVGRSTARWAEVVGYFVNPLPMRARPGAAQAFGELVAANRRTVLEAFDHQDLPFGVIVDELVPRHDPARSPLFQVFFALERAPVGGQGALSAFAVGADGVPLSLLGQRGETVGLPRRSAQFDLMLLVTEIGGELHLVFEYAADLFDPETPERMLAHLEIVARGAVEDPSRALGDLPLLTLAERQVLAATPQPVTAGDELLHEVFAARVAEDPDAVAVIEGVEELTYRQLDERAERLAAELRRRGARPEALVGLAVERSVDTLVALLATLKTGAGYLPLDPRHPPSRLRYVLDDARRVHPVPVLCARRDAAGELLAPLVDAGDPPVLWLDEVDLLPPAATDGDAPRAHADNVAYVIYTSGSTGEPKGVAVSHRNVVRLFRRTEEWFRFGRDDVWTFFHSHGFDFSVWEVWGALLYGGRVVVVPYWVSRDPAKFHDLLRTEGVTVLNQTPAAFRQLAAAEDEWRTAQPLRLRTVVFGGEALGAGHFEAWAARRGLVEPRLVNMYGITETTVHVTYRPLVDSDRGGGESRIGRPIPDLRVVLLDERLQPVAPGVPGEIHVGGPGLARGYLGRPGLTALRFVPDAYSGLEGERLYRSGDLARLRPHGDLEYLGRRDRQVKVRGFRIEPGEIETVLCAGRGVAEAVVEVRSGERGEPRLVGYLVAQRGESPDPEEIRGFAAARLPDYMVPATLVLLPELPLTPHGKVDRSALPEPGVGASHASSRTPPASEAERILAEVWSELTGTAQVAREDDFFALGGDSLLAARVVTAVRRRCGIELPLRRVFEKPRLADLAVELDALGGAGTITARRPIRRRHDDSPAPLSFAQERLWVVHRLDPASPAYNMPAAAHLEGDLSVPALAAALSEVVRRHEILRTRFVGSGEAAAMQLVSPHLPRPLPVVDLAALPDVASEREAARLTCAEAMTPFDLAVGPPFRSTLVRCARERHRLLLTLHHCVGDGWSLGVLVDELAVLYRAARSGRPSPLAELPVQYADYAGAQREHLQGGRLEALVAAWRHRLRGPLPVLSLPVDRPRPAVRSDRGRQVAFELDPPLSAAIDGFARQQRGTPFTVLVAVFQALLGRYSGQEDVVVGTDHANRGWPETERLIGFFVNLLPLRGDLSGRPGLRELVGRVAEVVVDAWEHHELPFDRLVSALRPPRELDHTPIFQVLFVFQNAPMPELELPAIRLRTEAVDTGRVKFDLVVFVEERHGRYTGSWHYRPDLFEAATIERLVADYRTLLAGGLASPERPLADVELVLDRDRREAHMESTRKRDEELSRLRRRPRQGVDLSRFDPVQRSTVTADGMPLVLEPCGAVDLREWVSAQRDQLEADLARHGAVLFRGFDIGSAQRFEELAGAVAGELYGEYGDLPHEPGDGKVYHSTPYPPDRPILYHNESAHLHQWPLKQFFHCVKVAEEGGETPIVDCRRVHRELDPGLRARFAERGLLYVRNFVEPFDVPWSVFFHTNSREGVEEYCQQRGIECRWKGDVLQTRKRAPAVARHPGTGEDLFFNQILVHHVACLEPALKASMRSLFGEEDLPRNVYYGDGTPIEDDVVLGLIELYDRLAVALPWQLDDVLLVDNMLVAHGRKPFRGSRKVCVAMGQMTAEA